MDGSVFCGNWNVLAGNSPGRRVHITRDPEEDESVFLISYRGESRVSNFEQKIYFDPETHTLQSRPDDGKPQRCVAFWQRPAGLKNCVFAMWSSAGSEEPGLPWEDPSDDNGSWGAEAG